MEQLAIEFILLNGPQADARGCGGEGMKRGHSCTCPRRRPGVQIVGWTPGLTTQGSGVPEQPGILSRNGSNIRNLEKLVSDGTAQIDNLEQKREIVAGELSKAQDERRALLLNGGSGNDKALARADARVMKATASLSGVDDALNELRQRIRERKAELEALRAQLIREGRSQEILAHIPLVEQALFAAEQPIRELILASRAAGGPAPEAEGAARLVEDIWGQLKVAVPSHQG